MTRYLDTDTGEVFDACPHCEDTRRECEMQIGGLERDLRTWRTRASKAEAKAIHIEENKRDGKEWKEIVSYWQKRFPDTKATALTMKSARATAYFQRMEAGADKDLFMLAIDGAQKLPFVIYGSRRAKGSKSDLKIDLQHIASIGNDAQFDQLVSAGEEARRERELF